MNQDAFTGGVEPGGLWNQNDIRILLCFILDRAGGGFTGEELAKITQQRGLANYFEVSDALAALIRQGNVQADSAGLLSVTAQGKEIAAGLGDDLPLSVRDKALDAALRLSAEARVRRENRVDIRETDNGFQVTCHISGGQMDLMAVTLYVPDRLQARRVEENFYRAPEEVYRLLLAALSGDPDFYPAERK